MKNRKKNRKKSEEREEENSKIPISAQVYSR
jgi:hypothetical protein